MTFLLPPIVVAVFAMPPWTAKTVMHKGKHRSGPAYTHEAVDRYVHALQPQWTPLEEVSPWLVEAVLLAEDGRFARHNGVDARATARAAVHSLQSGRMIGGSGIAQQAAKMIWHPDWRENRTVARKLAEAVQALWLVQEFGREWVLEAYLNLAEFWPGTRGVGIGAQGHLGVNPRNVTREQAVFLATVLPNPRTRPGTRRQAGVMRVILERL